MVRRRTSALRSPSGPASPLPVVVKERFPGLGSPDCGCVESFSPEQALSREPWASLIGPRAENGELSTPWLQPAESRGTPASVVKSHRYAMETDNKQQDMRRQSRGRGRFVPSETPRCFIHKDRWLGHQGRVLDARELVNGRAVGQLLFPYRTS